MPNTALQLNVTGCVSISWNVNLKHLFSYSAAYQYDVLHLKKTSDSSNESDIFSR